MAVIHGNAFLDWLKRAGLVPERTQRVVIEADYRSVVTIHAVLLGDSAMLEVDPVAVLGTNVRVVTADPDKPPAKAIGTDPEEGDLYRRDGDPEPPKSCSGLGLVVRVALVVSLPPLLFVPTPWACGVFG